MIEAYRYAGISVNKTAYDILVDECMLLFPQKIIQMIHHREVSSYYLEQLRAQAANEKSDKTDIVTSLKDLLPDQI